MNAALGPYAASERAQTVKYGDGPASGYPYLSVSTRTQGLGLGGAAAPEAGNERDSEQCGGLDSVPTGLLPPDHTKGIARVQVRRKQRGLMKRSRPEQCQLRGDKDGNVVACLLARLRDYRRKRVASARPLAQRPAGGGCATPRPLCALDYRHRSFGDAYGQRATPQRRMENWTDGRARPRRREVYSSLLPLAGRCGAQAAARGDTDCTAVGRWPGEACQL